MKPPACELPAAAACVALAAGEGGGLVALDSTGAAELPSNLAARGLSGRRDFGPRMGGTLSTHSTHSTLATGASIQHPTRLDYDLEKPRQHLSLIWSSR